MLHEIREYTAAPGKLDALVDRFNRHTFRLFRKHGMTLVQIGLTALGERSFSEVVYTLRFADAAEMERRWEAFLADEEVQDMFRETDAAGPLVHAIRRRLVTTSPFEGATDGPNEEQVP